MRVDVAFLPTLVRRPERTVCVVIDVLRATSTIATLFARGVSEIVAVAEIERAFALRDEARAAGEDVPLLCGELGGLPPAGFDFGNSPVEFSTMDLAGRRVVLFTSNGTKALVSVAASSGVWTGSLLNRAAVVRAATAAAESLGVDVTFVCSGIEFGTAFSLEDAFCAGALVEAYLSSDVSQDATLGDSAETALRLYRSFAGDARAAFEAAEHGRTLQRIGLADDLNFCAAVERYTAVPRALPQGDTVVLTVDDTSRVE
jgi:2-phosphosulfolactate phosphatase